MFNILKIKQISTKKKKQERKHRINFNFNNGKKNNQQKIFARNFAVILRQ